MCKGVRQVVKQKSVNFVQHLAHEIDEENVDDYLSNLYPLIGMIVVDFNGLESGLDSVLCEIFSDRSDSTGLIVLHKMGYAAKVDLFKRFNDDFQSSLNTSIDGYNLLLSNLKESGRLRNLVAHADWESTDEDGYTYIKLNISKRGMEQQYVQFSEDSLEKIYELILSTRTALGTFWDARQEALDNA
jgi:hypothetical protein